MSFFTLASDPWTEERVLDLLASSEGAWAEGIVCRLLLITLMVLEGWKLGERLYLVFMSRRAPKNRIFGEG